MLRVLAEAQYIYIRIKAKIFFQPHIAVKTFLFDITEYFLHYDIIKRKNKKLFFILHNIYTYSNPKLD